MKSMEHADCHTAHKRRIAVGTVTRNRPQMLERLLLSYSNLKLPENACIDFVIVENNSVTTLTEIIRKFADQVTDHNVTYLIEPELGIASARDHVLRFATENGFDILTFADDDEEVDEHWLVELLKERDLHDLDIVGSPVRLAPLKPSYSWWQRMVWAAVNDHNQRVEKRCIKRRNEGRADVLKIATGSWMGNLHFFRKTGLRFNTALGLAGGEDWRLYEDAKKLGARTGWTPHAIAYETLPAARLSLAYYYRRDRDHACMVFIERYRKDPCMSVFRLFGSIFVRIYKTIIALFMLPFRPKRALLSCVYHIGSSMGLIRACLGIESHHYLKTDGS